jgi:hypothetical protein
MLWMDSYYMLSCSSDVETCTVQKVQVDSNTVHSNTGGSRQRPNSLLATLYLEPDVF